MQLRTSYNSGLLGYLDMRGHQSTQRTNSRYAGLWVKCRDWMSCRAVRFSWSLARYSRRYSVLPFLWLGECGPSVRCLHRASCTAFDMLRLGCRNKRLQFWLWFLGRCPHFATGEVHLLDSPNIRCRGVFVESDTPWLIFHVELRISLFESTNKSDRSRP